MATTVTRYISAASAGGDGTTTALSGANAAYASIGAWVTARVAANANFVTADVIEKGICLPDAPFLERPNLTGATTDSTHYWWLTTSVRNNGTPGAGVVLDNENTVILQNASILALTNNYSRVDGLEIKNMRTANDKSAFFVGLNGIGTSAEGLLVHDCTTGTTQRPIGIGTGSSNTAANLVVENCIVYGLVGLHAQQGISFSAAGGCKACNNTIVNIRSGSGTASVIGINAGSRTTNTSQNNIVLNVSGAATNTCFLGTWGTIDHCISTDATATGTGSITSVTAANEVVSATEGSENCHLKAGAQAINAGADLSGSFTTDISGATRTGVWDIGADEFIAAATVAITRIMRLFEGFKIKFISGRLIIQQKQ